MALTYKATSDRIFVDDWTLVAAVRKVSRLLGVSPKQVITDAIIEYCTKKIVANSEVDVVWNR